MDNNNVVTNTVTAREFPVEAFYGSIMMRDSGVYMLDDDGNVRQFIALADAMAYRAWLWPDVYKIDRETQPEEVNA